MLPLLTKKEKKIFEFPSGHSLAPLKLHIDFLSSSSSLAVNHVVCFLSSWTLRLPQTGRNPALCRKPKDQPHTKVYRPAKLLLKYLHVLLLLKNPLRPLRGDRRAGPSLTLTPLSWTPFIPLFFKWVLKSRKTGLNWGRQTLLHPSVPYRRFLSPWSTRARPLMPPLCPRRAPPSPWAHGELARSATRTYHDSAWKLPLILRPRGHPSQQRTGLRPRYRGSQS